MNKKEICFIVAVIMIMSVFLLTENQFVNKTLPESDEVVLERTRPAGQVEIANEMNEKPPSEMHAKEISGDKTADSAQKENVEAEKIKTVSGEDIAKASCLTCHKQGLMSAPKIGDNSDWGTRYEKGLENLLSNALSGYKNMPARGGNPNLKENEVKLAIVFMLQQSGIDIPGNEAAPETVPIATSAPDSQPLAESTEKAPEPVSGINNLEVASESGVNQVEEVIQSQEDIQPATSQTEVSPVSYQVQEVNSVQEEKVIEMPGKPVYMDNCAACHDSGKDKAPVTGQQDAWIQAFSKGIDSLSRNMRKGPPVHPDVSNAGMTESQVTDAINYIMQQTFWPDPL